MKRKNKILTLAAIVCLLAIFSALGCVAFAEGNADNLGNVEAPAVDGTVSDPKDADLTDEPAKEENVFAVAFNYVKAYASELFCALTLICSMILTYACKRGIFPAVKSGVGIMKGAVKKIGEEVENAERDGKIVREEITGRLKETEKELVRLTEAVAALEGSLTPDERTVRMQNSVKELLAGQVNLISELVVTIAMPQSVKDRVSGKLARLIEAMEKYGE